MPRHRWRAVRIADGHGPVTRSSSLRSAWDAPSWSLIGPPTRMGIVPQDPGVLGACMPRHATGEPVADDTIRRPTAGTRPAGLPHARAKRDKPNFEAKHHQIFSKLEQHSAAKPCGGGLAVRARAAVSRRCRRSGSRPCAHPRRRGPGHQIIPVIEGVLIDVAGGLRFLDARALIRDGWGPGRRRLQAIRERESSAPACRRERERGRGRGRGRGREGEGLGWNEGWRDGGTEGRRERETESVRESVR